MEITKNLLDQNFPDPLNQYQSPVTPSDDRNTRQHPIVREHVQKLLADVNADISDVQESQGKKPNNEEEIFDEEQKTRQIFMGKNMVVFGPRLSTAIEQITSLSSPEPINFIAEAIKRTCNSYLYVFNKQPEVQQVTEWIKKLHQKLASPDSVTQKDHWSDAKKAEITTEYFSHEQNPREITRQIRMMDDILSSLDYVDCKISDDSAINMLISETAQTLQYERMQQNAVIRDHLKESENITFEQINQLAALLTEQEGKYLSPEEFSFVNEAEYNSTAVAQIYGEMRTLGKNIGIGELMHASNCVNFVNEELAKYSSPINEKIIVQICREGSLKIQEYISQSHLIKNLPPYPQQILKAKIRTHIINQTGNPEKKFQIFDFDGVDHFGILDEASVTATLAANEDQKSPIGSNTEIIETFNYLLKDDLLQLINDKLDRFSISLVKALDNSTHLNNIQKELLVQQGWSEYSSIIGRPDYPKEQIFETLMIYINRLEKNFFRSKPQAGLFPSDWKKRMRNFEKITNSGNHILHETEIPGINNQNRQNNKVTAIDSINPHTTTEKRQDTIHLCQLSADNVPKAAINNNPMPTSWWSKIKSFLKRK